MLRKIAGALILLALIFVVPILREESDAASPSRVLGILVGFTICAGILWGIRASWKLIVRLWSAKSNQGRVDPTNDKA